MTKKDKNSWTQSDYSSDTTEAAKRVLLELSRVLGAYSKRIVLIGGSVPPLLLPKAAAEHIGTTDIDLAIDHNAISAQEYKTIEDLLIASGYTSGKQPYAFMKKLQIDGTSVEIQVELLAGQYGGSGKGPRTQKVQGIRAMKMRGCDLAFLMCQAIQINGVMPSGALDSSSIYVPTMTAFLSMKGIALSKIQGQKYRDRLCIYRQFLLTTSRLTHQAAPQLRFECCDEFRGACRPTGIGIGAQLHDSPFIIGSAQPGAPRRTRRDTRIQRDWREHRMRLAHDMRMCATPGIFPRDVDHAGADRISLDIFQRGPTVRLI